MNLEQQRVRNGKSGAPALAATTQGTELEGQGEYHERELRLIAAFRVRDAANRIATLVGMSDSTKLRTELLALYDRLMGEERELLVRSMETVRFKAPPPTAKVTKKTA
jgi:hypothetical protein